MAELDPTSALAFEVPWTAEDSAILRSFLSTTTGQRLLGKILIHRPTCSERTDPFKRGIQSAIGEGYDEMFHRLRALCDSTKSVKAQ